jgi:hypothetical protein
LQPVGSSQLIDGTYGHRTRQQDAYRGDDRCLGTVLTGERRVIDGGQLKRNLPTRDQRRNR